MADLETTKGSIPARVINGGRPYQADLDSTEAQLPMRVQDSADRWADTDADELKLHALTALTVRSLIAVSLLTPVIAHAVPKAFDTPRLKLSGNLRYGVSSSDRALTDRRDISGYKVGLKLTHGLAPGAYFRFDGVRTYSDAAGGHSASALREAFFNYADGPIEMRIGMQINAWGRADVINPTDNLSPFRYTWLTENDGEQRLGSVAARISYRLGEQRLIGLVVPGFRPSEVPLGETGLVTVTENRPEEPVDALALKVDSPDSALEWSVSYLHGHSLRPSLVPEPSFEATGRASLRYPEVDVLGADFAYPISETIFRGEVAWTRPEDGVEAAQGEFEAAENIFGVLGVERKLKSYRVVTQAFHKELMEVADRPQSPALAQLHHGAQVLPRAEN